MAQIFSSSLATYGEEIINTELSSSLSDLKKFLNKRSLKVLVWNDTHIAVPVNVEVELPPLGNFEGIDIKPVEPVVLVFNIKSYPTVAPKVYPDRLDFPKDQLAHLYVARHGKPPAFCLVRGSLSEWYSNKQIKDLVIRIGNWLRDAATGELSGDGNQFDPVRLEGYIGTVIYDYDQLACLVKERKSFFPGGDFSVGLFERNVNADGFSFKLNRIVAIDNLNNTYEDFKKEKDKDNSLPSKKNYHFGYVVWSDTATASKQYSTQFPYDWEGFQIFCKKFGVNTEGLENYIANYDLNSFVMIPVIVGVIREKNLIGFSGNIEFFNFYLEVDTNDVSDGKIINNIPIKFQSHNQPLSPEKAREISGSQADLGDYSLIVGCGALGSKIIMHFARSGSVNFMLSDPDEFSPHNLVRHAAFANAEGMNKAAALKKEINNLYPYAKLPLLFATNKPGESFLTPDLTNFYRWILDFSASQVFFQSLIKADIPDQTRICRVFISDFGNLGIMLVEGTERNPRVDDLQAMLYASSRKLGNISSWLKREKLGKENNLSITVGVGCNSETTVLADDTVSLHASFFAAQIKSESQKQASGDGKIFLNEIHQEPFFSNVPTFLAVPKMIVLRAANDVSWQIRMKPGIIETIKKEMGLAMPHETGGVFVGCANYKTKTVHVVDIILAPPDSTANSVCFFRGVDGLPEKITEINESTGNQLGYIGEWHTHPFGPNMMSNVDFNTVQRFKNEFSNSPTSLPVFLLIVTPTHILSYIY